MHAISSLPNASPSELVEAIEACLKGMRAYLRVCHPEVALFHRRLAQALSEQADAAAHQGESTSVAQLRTRAQQAAIIAANGLCTSYGSDHPTVAEWRTDARQLMMQLQPETTIYRV